MSCLAFLNRQWAVWSINIWFLLLRIVQADLNNDTSPTHVFKSRPDLHAPMIELEYYDEKLVTPGYIFVGPYRNIDPGPYIYDNHGELVWSGAGWSGPRVAHTPRVCQYHGEDHLCFFTGEQHQGFSRGHGIIMDKHYKTVKTIEAHGAGTSSDMHEFKITPYSDGTSVLMTVYQPRKYDLMTNPRFNVKNGMGWIVEGVFQEIEIDTNKLLFEWRSLDHIDPSEAWTMPHTTDTSGNGVEEWHPWDYFHLNSIDKNKDGDYLISARHVSAIYKLSGKDGRVLWRLGGVKSDFVLTNFSFAYQHHARWLSETKEKTVISFFDNASNAANFTNEFSHGYIVEIDHVRRTATKTRQWGAPNLNGGGMRAGSQGSLQILQDGNVHICWGDIPHWSEHTWDGKPALYAKLAVVHSGVMNYRSNKYNWTAEPLTKPALWTYSRLGDEAGAKMGFWVSWNGATEVASWTFYVSESASGPWDFVAEEVKTGFETSHHRQKYSPWAWAQALDAAGNVLGDSMIARTFVPSEALRPFCGEEGCQASVQVKDTDEDHTPLEAVVAVDQKTFSTSRGFDTMNYYHGDFAMGPPADVEVAIPDDRTLETIDRSNRNEYHFIDSWETLGASSTTTYTSNGTFMLLFGIATGFMASYCFNFMRGKATARRYMPL